ncbi:MAG: hypothetical protein ACLU7X_06655 [Anaerostipes hadrus]
MNRKSKLKIYKGEEFKIAIKDIKDGDTIFYDQYKQALKMLETIVKTSHTIQEKEQKDIKNRNRNWQSEDYENNIIAFCGERGEGKSSAMCTFIKSLSNIDEETLDDMGIKSDKIKNTYFDEPIIIDPSQFDGVHNILDIVLAKIYEKFKEDYEKNEEVSERRKEELLNQFQKVYRQVSMINNQSKILDDEFDYEGNIGKLSKLGESTRLKTSLKKLLELYLQFRKDSGNGKKKGNHQIIIAIDDLDLCSANAYKMAEQIRKYLILPQIVIVMAVKIEQLELCVQERNLIDFEKVFKAYEKGNGNNMSNSQIYSEIFGMAERYVSKLIPKARRIYLPKVQSLENTDIIYQESGDGDGKIWSSDDSAENSLVEKVLKLITEKTGMIFLPEESGTSYLLPDNLREMVNWIVRLAAMDTPDDNKGYLENIQRFYKIFEIDVLDKVSLDGNENKLKAIGHMDVVHMHANTKNLMNEICLKNERLMRWENIKIHGQRAGELFEVMTKFEEAKRKVFDLEKERMIYSIKVLYTIIMNELEMKKKLFDIKGFVNGYIWGSKFQNVMPGVKSIGLDRSRFEVKTVYLYNMILCNYFKNTIDININLEHINTDNDEKHEKEIKPLYEEDTRINSVKNHDRKKDIVLIWTLIGLFCNSEDNNILYGNDKSIIFDNSGFAKKLQVSMENYIVNICNVRNLYYKINMKKLGVELEEFNIVAEFIENQNKEFISCMKKIISNIDIALDIKEYCKEHKDYKEATESRSKEIANTFLNNLYDYLKQKEIEVQLKKEEFCELRLAENKMVNVGELYADLVECGIFKEEEELRIEMGMQEGELNNAFRNQIDNFEAILSGDFYLYDRFQRQKFSSYLKNITSKNVITNLEKMASNVAYLRTKPESYDIGNRINELENKLRDAYIKVARIYVEDETEKLDKEIIQTYRELAAEENDLLNRI